MSWLALIDKLQAGDSVTFRPHGNSMTPRITSGQQVTVRPLSPDERIGKGDIVLAKVKGHVYLHLVTKAHGDQFEISNNHGHVNGWTTARHVYGKLVN